MKPMHSNFARTIASGLQRLFARATASFAATTIVLAFCTATAIVAPAQTFTTLLNFDFTNGLLPEGPLIQGTDGNLYGTTSGQVENNAGTVFKITPEGTLTTLYTFCSKANCTDGQLPWAGVMQATNGSFYGTTYHGGANNAGTVFQITQAGRLTTLYSFCAQANCADGAGPYGGLVLGTDGNLYGTTSDDGANGNGTVFKITTGGKLTTLYSFCSQINCTDGGDPLTGVIQGSDGNFYGTNIVGGNSSACEGSGCGTVFKITTSGTLTTLHRFCSQANCADGEAPEGRLVQGSDGNLYGTTEAGGSVGCYGNFGCGTIFKITPSGALTTLYSFCSNCVGGENPESGLLQGTDGSFYGTTSQWDNGYGTIFKITPEGTLTTLHTFSGTDGSFPNGLVQDTNGIFYGTADAGGNSDNCASYGYPGCGTVFSLSVGLGPFVETRTSSGKVGASIVILGTNLTGATSVSFNGAAATFTVVSSSEIKATVPADATTGTVEVTTPSAGTLKSNVVFRVTPQITSFTPASGPVGTLVTITGVSLTQATKVCFDGVPATDFTVDSETEVTATVPTGAKTGMITITTKGGTAAGAASFTVTE